jgi:putative PIN family toxin of toxin-antitoxin system
VIRAVLDANVIVAAMMNAHGAPADVVRSAARRGFTAVWSAPLIAECRRVAGYERVRSRLRVADPAAFITELAGIADLVTSPLPPIQAVKDDPTDDLVIATALAGGAGWIVTGDRAHLLPLDPFAGVRIVEPAAFLARL